VALTCGNSNHTVVIAPQQIASPPLSFVDLGAAAALGITAGIGARTFAWRLRCSKRIADSGHPAMRVIAAGSIAALFAIGRGLTGESLVLTPGYGVVQWALDPKRTLALLAAILILRCLATSAAITGGGVGGLFVPLVVAGALRGACSATSSATTVRSSSSSASRRSSARATANSQWDERQSPHTKNVRTRRRSRPERSALSERAARRHLSAAFTHARALGYDGVDHYAVRTSRAPSCVTRRLVMGTVQQRFHDQGA
jgi:hypothetical protein